jgi:hypothetical protein
VGPPICSVVLQDTVKFTFILSLPHFTRNL